MDNFATILLSFVGVSAAIVRAVVEANHWRLQSRLRERALASLSTKEAVVDFDPAKYEARKEGLRHAGWTELLPGVFVHPTNRQLAGERRRRTTSGISVTPSGV